MKWRYYELKEKISWWIAWKMPKKIVYLCAIRVTAYASTGKWSNQVVPELTAMDAVQRWEEVLRG